MNADSSLIQGSSLDEATALLDRAVNDKQIAGAVAAAAHHGKVVYRKAVGVQDVNVPVPMADRSLFRIYSMTKPVTAVAAMTLHEEGRFALSDPVSKYLPEFTQVKVRDGEGGATRPPARAITVEDLLLHTAGLNHRTSELYRREQVRSRRYTMATYLENLVRVPLMEDPGTAYRYGEGPTVVGRLIEIWSGKPFDEFLQERLFKPLRMNDTMFWVPPQARGRLTTVYTRAADGGLTPIEMEPELPFTERPTLLEGAISLVSTVPDYLRFAQMLLNKGELDGVRILKPATVERITSNGLPDSMVKARRMRGWGLGNVEMSLDPNAPHRGEYGWNGSADTAFWVDPARELAVVFMTQRSPANPDSLRGRFKAIIDRAIQ